MGILSKLFPACCSPSPLAEQRRQSQRISDGAGKSAIQTFDEMMDRMLVKVKVCKEAIQRFYIACNPSSEQVAQSVEANAVKLRELAYNDPEAQEILELIINIEMVAESGYQAGYQVGGSKDVASIIEYKQNVARLAEELTLAGTFARYYMAEVNSALFEQSASASRGFCCC